MNKKILLILVLCILLLCLNVNASLNNSSFEIASSDTNTLAKNWNYLSNIDSLCQTAGFGNCVAPYIELAGIRTYQSDANNGSFVIDVNNMYIGTTLFLVSDLNFSNVSTNIQVCMKLRLVNGGSSTARFIVYDPVTNRISWWGQVAGTFGEAYTLASTDWVNVCRPYGNDAQNYLFGIAIRYVGAAGGEFQIDDVHFSYPIDIDILNGTQAFAVSNDTVVFKTKVLRTDLNSFITDADVQLISKDFNGTMVFNSATQYYELSHAFGSIFGEYDFNVSASDTTGDLNFSDNDESFSLIFRKTSSQLSNVSNSVILEEYQYTDETFKGVIVPSDDLNNLIYKFTGQDESTTGNSIDFNFSVRNSDLSGKRYLIYTASENDYLNGTWNFDSTLSFGSIVSNGIQKIYVDANEFYNYSFMDSSLLSNEIKYYKLVYAFPFQYWDSLNPNNQTNAFKLNNWDLSLLPSVFVTESGHKSDYFAVSTYNNVRNQLKEKLPDINSNTTYNKFLLVFNAVSDSAFTIHAGSNLGGVNDSITAVSVLTTNTTFAVNTGAFYPLIKADSTSFKQLNLSDYALIERGFFLKPLELKNQDGSPIEARLVSGVSAKVIKEGAKFRVQTELYNKDNLLSFIEAKVYFGSVDVANQVSYFKMDLNFLGENELYNLDWLVDGIIDLNGTTARDFVVVVKATNKNADWFEIQTDTFKLRQYPTYSDEFNLGAYITSKKVGEHLSGVVQINTDNPNALRGVTFSLWKPDTQSIEANDYNVTLFKDKDFSCSAFSCTFNFEFLDHVLDDEVIWALNLSALLNTQTADTNSYLTAKTIRFSVYFQDINLMRIVETMERTAHTYKHTEPIPLTLILVKGDLHPSRDDLKIVLRASNCSTDATNGTCTDIDINYSPDSYVYDSTTGENFYFWRQIYVDSDLSLLDDGDYYRFYAVIESINGKFSSVLKPLLSAKCQTYDAGDFGHQVLHFFLGQGAYTGCTVNTSHVVSIDSNSQESRILIDRSLVTQKPNLEFTVCLNADQNNHYRDNLKQDLLCAAAYTFNEAPIDKFDFYLTNQFSDLSRTDSSERQFLKATMPFPLLALNDISLMRQSLKQEYQTEATTIGELLLQGFNYFFTGFANPILNGVFTANEMTGAIPNIGADFNLNRPLDPTYIGGLVFFKVKGINVLNKQDLIRQYPNDELDSVDSSELIKYLNYKGLAYSVDESTIEIYGYGMKRSLIVKDKAPLVIDEEITVNSYTKTDENKNFQSLPTKLRFSVLTDLWYDDERHVKKTVVPITITALISEEGGFDVAKLIGENIFYIFIGLAFLLIISVVYYNFKVRGGN